MGIQRTSEAAHTMNSSNLFQASVRSVSRQTWAVLAALVLGVLLLADGYYPDYVEQLEKRDDLVLRAQRTRALAELLPKFQQKLADQDATYQLAVAQSFVNPDASTSVDQFRGMVRTIFQDTRIMDASDPVVDQQPEGNTSVLTLVTQFTCIPRQLAELERQLLAAPKRIQATALHAEVVPDPLSGGQQLKVSLTLMAVHLTNVTDPQK